MFIFAVIVALPFFTPVICPTLLIVTIELSDVDQIILSYIAFSGSIVLPMYKVLPTAITGLLGDNVISLIFVVPSLL